MIIKNLILTAFETNCYLVGCPRTREALVIDPGADPETICQTLAEQNLTLKYIVCTHAHLDHSAGVKELKSLTAKPFLMHRNEMPILQQMPAQAANLGLKTHGVPEVDQFVADGDEINVGDITFKVMATPGHSPGGICLDHGDTVFVGDTIFAGSIGRTDLFGGSFPQLMNSIRTRLMTLPDDTRIFTGHGPATTVGEERYYNPFASHFLNE